MVRFGRRYRLGGDLLVDCKNATHMLFPPSTDQDPDFTLRRHPVMYRGSVFRQSQETMVPNIQFVNIEVHFW